MGFCEECRGRTYGPNEECRNPECALYVPSESASAAPRGPQCSCGEAYEGRPCAPDCELEREYERRREASREE